jgi:6-phosphogluconolactonase (cycloisomerase 2 family)
MAGEARAFAFVGSRTSRERRARGSGITTYRVDPSDGRLEQATILGDVANPSYLVLNREHDKLYAVHGDSDEVSVLGIDANDGALRALQQRKCHGFNPVHLALAPDNRHLVVSNFEGPEGGSIVVLPVDEEGLLGEFVQRVTLPGTLGPHRTEQTHSKPHSAVFDRGGRYLAVADKGQDRVYGFRYDDGRLIPAAKPWTDTRQGAGPRLAVFHPNGRCVYVLNDLDSTAAACRFDPNTGEISPFQVLSTLSEQHVGDSRAATITLSSDGRHLYVSNRGEDSIAVFAVAARTGLLRKIEVTSSGGSSPRFCTPDPSGRWLYVLNEGSDSICAFRIDPDSGRVRHVGSTPSGSPLCMTFFEGLP